MTGHNPVLVLAIGLLALAACGEPVSSQQDETGKGRESPVAAPAPTDPAIAVKQIVFVATDAVAPGAGVLADFQQHLLLALARFTELLSGRDSFALETGAPDVLSGNLSTAEYRSLPESGVPRMISEILAHEATDRFDCRHIWVILFANSGDDFPAGGGRPLNGGYNTGCGLVVMSSYSLEVLTYFQSTLQHELGHSFGLPHVDGYGYDMASNESIMSYNLLHRTDGFSEAPDPGILIPEDLRGLASNDRVFPHLEFSETEDVPVGYALHSRIVWLGPMDIPGQVPYTIQATTSAGALFGSAPANAVIGVIEPSGGPDVYFNAATMWQSDSVGAGGVVVLDLAFPMAVALDRILVYSGHSGLYHRATSVVVSVDRGRGFEEIGRRAVTCQDDGVVFDRTESVRWRLAFETGISGMLTLRGLRFFQGGREWFAPLVPPATD